MCNIAYSTILLSTVGHQILENQNLYCLDYDGKTLMDNFFGLLTFEPPTVGLCQIEKLNVMIKSKEY